MPRFCTRCGRPLQDGEVCHCPDPEAKDTSSTVSAGFTDPLENYSQAVAGNSMLNSSTQPSYQPNPAYQANPAGMPQTPETAAENPAAVDVNHPQTPEAPKAPSSSRGFEITLSSAGLMAAFENFKNRTGIGDPELNKEYHYEQNLQIVPEVVAPETNETFIEQFDICTMRNRFFAIPYAKAIGRLCLTTNRLIFRAPGKSVSGRTSLQYEFDINDIDGMDYRRENSFGFWFFLLAVIVLAIGCGIGDLIISAAAISALVSSNINLTGTILLTLILGVAGAVPFFWLHKKWLIKLLCLGISLASFMVGSTVLIDYGYFMGGGYTFLGWLYRILFVFCLVCTLFALFIYSIRPNLVLVFKTKEAQNAIVIAKRSRKAGLLNETGYAEIVPAENLDAIIKKIMASIREIQNKNLDAFDLEPDDMDPTGLAEIMEAEENQI